MTNKIEKNNDGEDMSEIAQGIAQGIREVIAYVNGEPNSVRVTHYSFADAKAIRERLGLSQSVFAKTYNIPLNTLQNWEQKRYCPDSTASAYLWAIENMPDEIKAVQERHPIKWEEGSSHQS